MPFYLFSEADTRGKDKASQLHGGQNADLVEDRKKAFAFPSLLFTRVTFYLKRMEELLAFVIKVKASWNILDRV